MKDEQRWVSGGKVLAVLALVFTACSSAKAGGGAGRAQAELPTTTVEVTTTVVETTTTTTMAAATTTTRAVAVAAAVQKAASASIASVRALQQRLAELGYDVGAPDGRWSARTTYAVMAFQKVEGLARDGADNPQTRAALATATRPGPMVPGGAPTRIEIDVARQVLFYWVDGSLTRILPVSTGNNQPYCAGGHCDVAVTPGGTFQIGRKATGLEISPLGELWWPMYFNGGIAVHGSPAVTPYPASHGCVRIPMYAAPTFFAQVSPGTPVHVLNSPPGPAPPDEGKAVPGAVAPPDTTTTVAAPVATTTTAPTIPATTTVATPTTTTTSTIPAGSP